jgi:class 3 adenylate cyclase
MVDVDALAEATGPLTLGGFAEPVTAYALQRRATVEP